MELSSSSRLTVGVVRQLLTPAADFSAALHCNRTARRSQTAVHFAVSLESTRFNHNLSMRAPEITSLTSAPGPSGICRSCADCGAIPSSSDPRSSASCADLPQVSCTQAQVFAFALPLHVAPGNLGLAIVSWPVAIARNAWLIAGTVALLLICSLLLYGFAAVLVRRRMHKLSEELNRFVTSGFQGPALLRTAPRGIVLDPGGEIATLESSAELLCSAIQDSKRRMVERERQHLEWLAFLCHDLAAPLARVQSRVDALERDTGLTPEEREALFESARAEIAETTELIGSISQFAQLESGVERKFEETSLDPLLEHAVSVFEFEASKKAVELDLRIRPGIGLVRIDKCLIRRAIENLISNALRFTPEGGLISVCAERREKLVQIHVMDTGTGIPLEELPRIFEFEFHGNSQARPARLSSQGLGLALVRKVVELHHGEVTARNVEPAGTEFIISLPLET